MKNFIFKSSKDSDLHKMLFNKLDMLLAEQRHQRVDLAHIIRQLHTFMNDSKLQKQVTSYFEDDDPGDVETSPQTDLENKDES